jgi:hypothetical protein
MFEALDRRRFLAVIGFFSLSLFFLPKLLKSWLFRKSIATANNTPLPFRVKKDPRALSFKQGTYKCCVLNCNQGGQRKV